MKNTIRQSLDSSLINSDNPTAKKNHKPLIIRIIIVLLLFSAIIVYYFYADTSSYKGTVESLIVPSISEVSGKIIKSNISLGQPVKIWL